MHRFAKKDVPCPPVLEGGGSNEQAGEDGIAVMVNGVRLEVSPELKAAVLRAHRASMRELPAEMTSSQAAEFLDVSRPFVIKLTARGELPCRRVGKHRRIPTDALVAYREKMFHEASQAADEISRLVQDAGPYDKEPGGRSQ